MTFRPVPTWDRDDKVRRYLVYLKYWTLILNPPTVYPEVLFPPNFIILHLGTCWASMKQAALQAAGLHAL